jgi:uncharacterized HAD superfamily protein
LTDPAIRKVIQETFGVYLHQQQIVHYEYHRCGISMEQEQRVLEIFRDATCSELAVIPGAVEALRLLKQKHRVILVTSRHPAIRGKTEDWLRLNDIPHDLLIFENAKHRTGQAFDYFIEDSGESAVSLAETGIRTFLFDYPWNRSIVAHTNIARVLGWQDILAELT